MAPRADKTSKRQQRRRIVLTALIFGAIALAFYVYSIVRFV